MFQLAVFASTDCVLMPTAATVATDHIGSVDHFDGDDGRAATFLCSLATQCGTSLTKSAAAQDAEGAAALKVNARAAAAVGAALMRTGRSNKLRGRSRWHRKRASVAVRSCSSSLSSHQLALH